MSIFMLEASEDSPYVLLNSQTGKLMLNGRCIMSDTLPFQNAILEWFRKYISVINREFELEINLEYINSDSHKMLLHLIAELNKYFIFGKKVSINWITVEEDEYMMEVIQEFKEAFDLPINEKILA